MRTYAIIAATVTGLLAHSAAQAQNRMPDWQPDQTRSSDTTDKIIGAGNALKSSDALPTAGQIKRGTTAPNYTATPGGLESAQGMTDVGKALRSSDPFNIPAAGSR